MPYDFLSSVIILTKTNSSRPNLDQNLGLVIITGIQFNCNQRSFDAKSNPLLSRLKGWIDSYIMTQGDTIDTYLSARNIL